MLLCLSSVRWCSVLEESVEAAGEVAFEGAVGFAACFVLADSTFDGGDRDWRQLSVLGFAGIIPRMPASRREVLVSVFVLVVALGAGSGAAKAGRGASGQPLEDYAASQKWTVEAVGRSAFLAAVIKDWAHAGDPPFLDQVTIGCGRIRGLVSKRRASEALVVPTRVRSADVRLARAYGSLRDRCRKATTTATVAISSLRSPNARPGDDWRLSAAAALDELPKFAGELRAFIREAAAWRTTMRGTAKRSNTVLPAWLPGLAKEPVPKHSSPSKWWVLTDDGSAHRPAPIRAVCPARVGRHPK